MSDDILDFEKKSIATRVENITFTRFLAAISIVIFHHGLQIFPFNQPELYFLFANANVGVSYFFVLSGFVMVLAYFDKGNIEPINYYKSRFARIYPAYFLALLLYFFSKIKNLDDFDFSGFFLNLFMLQAWVPGKALSFNGPGWSLSVEMFFYALFPFLFNYFYRVKSIKNIMLMALVIFVFSQALLNSFLLADGFNPNDLVSHDLLYYFPPMHLNEFLVGNCAGLFFVSKIRNKFETAYGVFFVFLFLFILVLALRFPVGLSLHNGLLALIFVPMIIFISLDRGALSRLVSSKPFVFLGEISFGIYILQMPIKGAVYKMLVSVGVLDPAAKFYIYVVTLICVSAVSYVFFETPLRKIINGWRLVSSKKMST